MQWPEVYDLCHTFLHVELVKKHMAMRESHVFHMAVFFFTRSTCKNVQQNLIPLATAYQALTTCWHWNYLQLYQQEFSYQLGLQIQALPTIMLLKLNESLKNCL